MTLRTGKSGQYRYYTCDQSSAGRDRLRGRTVPMEKLDTLAAEHIEQRLLQPKRLERILSTVLTRREERAERRVAHIAQLHKRAAEAEAKLKRLYDAIENGVADLNDPMLKDRIAELKAVRDQARADAERAQEAIDRTGLVVITPQTLKTFARQTAGPTLRRTEKENPIYILATPTSGNPSLRLARRSGHRSSRGANLSDHVVPVTRH